MEVEEEEQVLLVFLELIIPAALAVAAVAPADSLPALMVVPVL